MKIFLVHDCFLESKYRYQFLLKLKAIKYYKKFDLWSFFPLSFRLLFSDLSIYSINNRIFSSNTSFSTFKLRCISGLRYNYLI